MARGVELGVRIPVELNQLLRQESRRRDIGRGVLVAKVLEPFLQALAAVPDEDLPYTVIRILPPELITRRPHAPDP